jgi:hypothetical protein
VCVRVPRLVSATLSAVSGTLDELSVSLAVGGLSLCHRTPPLALCALRPLATGGAASGHCHLEGLLFPRSRHALSPALSVCCFCVRPSCAPRSARDARPHQLGAQRVVIRDRLPPSRRRHCRHRRSPVCCFFVRLRGSAPILPGSCALACACLISTECTDTDTDTETETETDTDTDTDTDTLALA